VTLKLYTYFRGSAEHRVRLALDIKGLDCESIPVHLLRESCEQRLPYCARANPGAQNDAE